MQANDPEFSNQEKTIILNVVKRLLGVIQFSGAVAMYILWEFHKIEIHIWRLLLLKRNQCRIIRRKARF